MIRKIWPLNSGRQQAYIINYSFDENENLFITNDDDYNDLSGDFSSSGFIKMAKTTTTTNNPQIRAADNDHERMIRVSEEVAEQITGRYRRISATHDVLDEDIRNAVEQRQRHRMLGKCSLLFCFVLFESKKKNSEIFLVSDKRNCMQTKKKKI